MIEAVGWQYFDTLLPPLLGAARPATGCFFLQAIVVDDRAYEIEKASKHASPSAADLPRRLPARRSAADPALHRRSETDLRTGLHWTTSAPSYAADTRRAGANASPTAERARGARLRRVASAALWEPLARVLRGRLRARRRIADLQMVFAKPGWRGAVPARLSAEVIGA